MSEEDLKLIKTIGEQWKLLLVIFFIIVFTIKWKTIWSLVSNFTQIRVKRGDNEIELQRENKETKDNEKEVDQKKIKPDSETSEEKNIEEVKIEKPDDIDSLYFEALNNKKFGEAKTHFEKIIEVEKNPVIINEKRVRNFYWRFYNGDTSAIDEFEKYISSLNNDDEQKSFALYYMGLINKDSNISIAIDETKKALGLTKNEEHKVFCLSKLAELHYDNGEKEKALSILLDHINSITERNPKSNLYRAIAEFYKKAENKLFESIAYQKALELNPNNINLLFDSAYNYSETKNNLTDLGLLIYKKILIYNSNNQAALNNIGVAYQNLKLNFKSIKYYKKAFEAENSLAASNLSNLLIDKGFEDEALGYLEKAETFKDVHDNVYTSTSTLKNSIKDENEQEEKILNIASKKFLFFNHFGTAIFSNKQFKIENSSNWFHNDIKLSVSTENDFLNIKWEIGEEKHRIYGDITKNGVVAHYEKPKKNIYSYSPETKYTINYFDGFGYFSNENDMYFIFEIDKEIKEFKFVKK